MPSDVGIAGGGTREPKKVEAIAEKPTPVSDSTFVNRHGQELPARLESVFLFLDHLAAEAAVFFADRHARPSFDLKIVTQNVSAHGVLFSPFRGGTRSRSVVELSRDSIAEQIRERKGRAYTDFFLLGRLYFMGERKYSGIHIIEFDDGAWIEVGTYGMRLKVTKEGGRYVLRQCSSDGEVQE